MLQIILTLVIFVLLLFHFFRDVCSAFCRERDSFSRFHQTAVAAGMAGFLVQAMTDYSFYNYRVMFLFWVFIALGGLLADRFGIARSRELLGCFHSDRIRDYIQWGYELDTAEAAALTSSYSNSELRAPLRIDGYRYCYAPVSFSYNNGSSRYTTSGDTLRLYLPDGRELFRRSFDELFTERCDQLLYWPDDELLYTADNLLFYRTDSLLISFSWAEVSRGKHRYVALNVDKFYTK